MTKVTLTILPTKKDEVEARRSAAARVINRTKPAKRALTADEKLQLVNRELRAVVEQLRTERQK